MSRNRSTQACTPSRRRPRQLLEEHHLERRHGELDEKLRLDPGAQLARLDGAGEDAGQPAALPVVEPAERRTEPGLDPPLEVDPFLEEDRDEAGIAEEELDPDPDQLFELGKRRHLRGEGGLRAGAQRLHPREDEALVEASCFDGKTS